MLRSLGHIAEAIDAVMVAEGIETADDLMVLHDLGVKYGQGFFLARPGPPFPRLRASVRRAIRTLVESSRAPIAVPPADYDEHGEVREAAALIETGRPVAEGSGELFLPRELPAELRRRPAASGSLLPLRAPVDDGDEGTGESSSAGDDGHERTNPALQPWRPLSVDEMRREDGEGTDPALDDAPLLQSLRRDTADLDDPGHGTEPGKGLN
jgi:hypothetical protein